MTPLYDANGVTLYNGDVFAFFGALADESVDAIVTDPPYSSGGMFRSDRIATTREKYVHGETKNVRDDFSGDNRDQRSFEMWATLWITEALRILKPGGVLLIFADWRQLPTMTDALQAGGLIWRGIVVWNKTDSARPQLGRFKTQCEYVPWGSKGPLLEDGMGAGALMGCFTWAPVKNRLHQTQKPIGLMEDLLAIVPRGGIVADPFIGSGSTIVAAHNKGIQAIGNDIDTQWVNVTIQRVERSPVVSQIITPIGRMIGTERRIHGRRVPR